MTWALTVWQPWATLIVAGAKPHEFRGWDYSARPQLRPIVGQRIAIHAGCRPARLGEVADLYFRLDDGETGLDVDIARPILKRLGDALSAAKDAREQWRRDTRAWRKRSYRLVRMKGDPPDPPAPIEPPSGQTLPLGAVIGTAVIGKPVPVAELFAGKFDSDRLDHSKWGWPMLGPEPIEPIQPCGGQQGFWEWPR